MDAVLVYFSRAHETKTERTNSPFYHGKTFTLKALRVISIKFPLAISLLCKTECS